MNNVYIKLPIGVKYILDTLHNNHYEAFIIGGCVRDSLLNVPVHDWDITTNALPDEIEKLFALTYPTGKIYGTITVAYVDEKGDQSNYEVTTYRKDQNYSDGRRPDKVTFSKHLKDDVKRRDFTINAIAYNEEKGLIDYYHGIKDLKNKTLRTVRNPYERFNEDALRTVRAIRFSLKYRLDVEKKTLKAIKDLTSEKYLAQISRERIHDEIIKMSPYLTTNFSTFSLFVDQIKLILAYKGDLIINSDRLDILLAGYYYNLNNNKLLHDLKYSNDEIQSITNLIKASKILDKIHYSIEPIIGKDARYLIRKAISETSKHYVIDALRIHYTNKLCSVNLCNNYNREDYITIPYSTYEPFMKRIIREESKNCTSIKQLVIDGDYLKENYNLDGKQLGDVLKSCFEYVLKNPQENNFEKLSSYIKTLLK